MNKIKNFFVYVVIKIDKIFFKMQLFKIHLFNCVSNVYKRMDLQKKSYLYNNYFKKDYLERRKIYLS